ncbi:MAG: hypothetical protein CL878_03675 [Dehalococcoidia bacterium]|nr:hypothetical protein [Dehalococcoidia bacterium]
MKSDPTDGESLEPPSSDTTELHFSGRGLTEVPEWVGQLSQLQSLNLAGNRLRWTATHPWAQGLAWSRWRRGHQKIAQACHRRRRLRQEREL